MALALTELADAVAALVLAGQHVHRQEPEPGAGTVPHAVGHAAYVTIELAATATGRGTSQLLNLPRLPRSAL